METKVRLLVVDDDTEIRDLLSKVLTEYGFDVLTAQNGLELFKIIANQEIHLIILDVMLPGESGLSLCQKLRSSTKIPIIMLTAIGEDVDRIAGLEMGADDYLAKPFNPRELAARIKAVLRRILPQAAILSSLEMTSAAIDNYTSYQFAGWNLDIHSRKLLSPDEVEVNLSTAEYSLLAAFIDSPQKVLSRDQLLDYTQHRPAGPFDRTIDVQVSRLRQKIEIDPKQPKLIKTVRGGGYLFTAKTTKIINNYV